MGGWRPVSSRFIFSMFFCWLTKARAFACAATGPQSPDHRLRPGHVELHFSDFLTSSPFPSPPPSATTRYAILSIFWSHSGYSLPRITPSTINGSISCDCLTSPSFIPRVPVQPRLLRLRHYWFTLTCSVPVLHALGAIFIFPDLKQGDLATGARSVLKRADGNRKHRLQYLLVRSHRRANHDII